MRHDRLIQRIIRRHLDHAKDHQAAAAVGGALDDQVELLEVLLSAAREIDYIRHETHALIEADGDPEVLERVAAARRARHMAIIDGGLTNVDGDEDIKEPATSSTALTDSSREILMLARRLKADVAQPSASKIIDRIIALAGSITSQGS